MNRQNNLASEAFCLNGSLCGRRSAVPEQIEVVLACCRIGLQVTFDERGSPATAPHEIRQNVSCPLCRQLIILSLKERDGKKSVDQEVIDLG